MAKRLPSTTVIALGFFALFIIYAILTRRSLYADGSYYFLRVLEAGNFTEMIGCRSFAAYLFQLPVVIAIKLGVANIHWLAIAFGIGCLCSWPVAMFLCYRMAPQHFWLVILACAAGYLNAAFMAVGEHIVAHAFFWPALFAILFVRPLTPFAAASLSASAIMLMRSYESMLFLAPPMIGLLVWRMISGKERLWQLAVLGSAAVFLVVSAYIAWLGVEYPNVENYNGFKSSLFSQLKSPTWTLQMSVFWAVLMLGALNSRMAALLKRPAGIVLIALIAMVWGASPLLAPQHLNPASQYDCRFLDLVVPLFLIPLAFMLALRPDWLAAKIPDLARLSAMMLIAQSLWHLSATYQWRNHVRDWETMLAAKHGPIFPSTYEGFDNPDMSWNNPSLSLMLGPARVQAMVMPAHVSKWLPFDPFRPKTFPDFQRYGVDYTEYFDTLRRKKLIHE
jgi:hypothetical protein